MQGWPDLAMARHLFLGLRKWLEVVVSGSDVLTTSGAGSGPGVATGSSLTPDPSPKREARSLTPRPSPKPGGGELDDLGVGILDSSLNPG